MRVLLFLALALLSGCVAIYKMDMRQGNLVDQKMVDKLKPGMTKRQVTVVMGTPLVNSPFNQDRWEYLTSYSRRGRKADIKNLSLRFEGDTLAKIEGDWQQQDEDELFLQSQALRPSGDRDTDSKTLKNTKQAQDKQQGKNKAKADKVAPSQAAPDQDPASDNDQPTPPATDSAAAPGNG